MFRFLMRLFEGILNLFKGKPQTAQRKERTTLLDPPFRQTQPNRQQHPMRAPVRPTASSHLTQAKQIDPKIWEQAKKMNSKIAPKTMAKETQMDAERVIASYLSGFRGIDETVRLLGILYNTQSRAPDWLYVKLVKSAREIGFISYETELSARKEILHGRDGMFDEWEHLFNPRTIKTKKKKMIKQRGTIKRHSTLDLDESLRKQDPQIKTHTPVGSKKKQRTHT